jgi:tryptophan halogenase
MSDLDRIKDIIIVGGGSAGWMTAAYLNAALNDRGQSQMLNITLIESPDIPRISVGEATVPSIHHMMDVIGINEADFMKRTEATFKQSIKYVNWLENKGEGYHHPFSRATPGPIDRTGRHWMKSRRDIPFVETVSSQAVISDINLSPRPLDNQGFVAPLKYAYHFDAQLYADYLTEIATAAGVRHIRANVEGAERDQDGLISHVTLENGETIEGDFFIDCTGFKALLMEGVMGEPWIDFSQWLLCDRAIVSQFDYQDHFPGVIRPYTTCTAQSAGWIWDTPTQTRRAIGYVHASAFISEADAKAELLRYQNPDLEDWPTRTIHFKVGHRRKAWTGNCMAIGLSGGFIEPLESTGIYLAELGAVMLSEHFPASKSELPKMARRVNRVMTNRYYEVLDFINLHYCLSRRDDTPFWREVQKSNRITDRVKAKLAHWSQKEPSRSDFDDAFFNGPLSETMNDNTDPEMDPRPPVDTAGLWDHTSYEAILFGMDFRGEEFAGLGDQRPPSRPVNFVIQALQAAPKRLPPHHIWLHQALGMPAWPIAANGPAGWVKRTG